MDKLFENLETNIKLAYKSVTFHFKSFIWFYIALFIVQASLGIVNISMQNQINNTREVIERNHTSHYVLYYMNTNQKYYVMDAADYKFSNDHYFDIYTINEYNKETENKHRCDIYINFLDDPNGNYERFEREIIKGLEERGEVHSSKTPLFELENTINDIKAEHYIYSFIIAVLSFVLLTVLYNIRANNFRFDYGVYMAFGADKKKLLKSSFWEMTVITLLTFIPAALVAIITNYVCQYLYESKFSFNILQLFSILLITLAVNSVSIVSVIIKTSLKTPISLLVSRDNSNFVHSPRRSKNLFSKHPLFKLNNLSILRYSKYYILLVLSGVIFSSIFVCFVFGSNLYTQNANKEMPQFKVTFENGNSYTQNDYNVFSSIDGIKKTYKEDYTNAAAMGEHILIDRSAAKFGSNRVIYDDSTLAMDNVNYYAADEEVVKYLSTKKHTGKLSSIFEDENKVIISDSFNNTTHFNFKVGDKIKIGDLYDSTTVPDGMLTGQALLKRRIEDWSYRYKEVTVGAILHDDFCNDNLKIYMCSSLYKKTTKNNMNFTEVYLYADPDLSIKQTKTLHTTLLKYALHNYSDDTKSNVFVEDLYSNLYTQTKREAHLEKRLSILSVGSLVLCSVIWFFSQSLFYKKRTSEFITLEAIGYTKKQIVRMFLHDIMCIGAYTTVFYSLLTYLLCFIMYKFMNSWLFGYTFRYTFNIPLKTFVFGLIITLVFAGLSTILPYFYYKLKNKTLILN